MAFQASPRCSFSLLLAASVLAACSNPKEEDLRVCDGYSCTAGYCISDNGKPACVCGAFEQAAGLQCELSDVSDRNEPNDSVSTATPLTPNGDPVPAALTPHADGQGDNDYYRIDAQAGLAYWALLVPSKLHATLLDANGTDLKRVSILASQAGTYYLRVQGSPTQGEVPYTVSLAVAPDDYPNSPAEPPRDLSSARGGAAQYEDDVDVLRVQLAAGHYYSFGGTITSGGPLGTALVDASGAALAAQSPFRSDTDQTAFLELQAQGQPVSYTPFVEDLGFDADGDTAATATAILPSSTPSNHSFQAPTDVDWFRFAATANTVYRAECVPQNQGTCTMDVFDAAGQVIDSGPVTHPRSGTDAPLYLRVHGDSVGAYTLSFDVYEVDDPGATLDTARTLPIDTPVTALFYLYDTDVWAWDAPAQAIYRVDCTGECNLPWPAPPAADDTQIVSAGYDGYLLIKSEVPQRVGVAVAGSIENSYTLTLSQIATDDYGDMPSHAAPITLSTSLSGAIDSSADQDFFAVQLTGGAAYRLTWSGAIHVEVHDAQGFTVASTWSTATTLDYTAASDGTYYIKVAGQGGQTPIAYTLQIAPN